MNYAEAIAAKQSLNKILVEKGVKLSAIGIVPTFPDEYFVKVYLQEPTDIDIKALLPDAKIEVHVIGRITLL